MKSFIKKLLNESIKETKSFKLLTERENRVKANRLLLILEKEIKVGDNLTKKLNNINTPLAKKLLAFFNSDKIKNDANVDYVDYDKKNEKLITLGYRDMNGKVKERLFKINKLIKYLGSDINDIKDYEIEDLIGHLKQADTSQLKMVEGDDILKAYHCENYEDGETMGSCMRFDYAQEYLKIYTDNPNEVKCLVLLNPETNKVRGRALIWHMDNDKYFMDRVYTTNKEFNTYFNNYAEENGISKRANSTVTLENGGEYDTYPYMDTFQYYHPESGSLAADGSEVEGSIRLQDTSGGHSEAGVYIEYGDHEGETVDEDEAYYISYRTPDGYREGYAHQDDVIPIDGDVYLMDDCIKTYDHEWVYKYDDYSFPIELTAGRYEGEYAKLDDTVELEHNYYGEGQYITTEDDYIQLDDDIYEIPHALTDDTVETYTDKTILKADAIRLYEPHYGEYNYGHPEEATKVDIKDYGEAWVLDDDLDEFQEEGLIESKSNIMTENKKTIKKLLKESLKGKVLFTEATENEPCDCCKYFDMDSVSMFTGMEHPIYSILSKGKIEKLMYINPKQYIYKIAHGFGGLSYADVVDSGEVSIEHVIKYAEAMKNGDKFPVGYYTEDGSGQEGRHRALALMSLGCEQMPVVVKSEISRDEMDDFVNQHKHMTYEELNDLFKGKGYHGISGLDWREFKNYIEYRL
jgi:hypothetical protein